MLFQGRLKSRLKFLLAALDLFLALSKGPDILVSEGQLAQEVAVLCPQLAALMLYPDDRFLLVFRLALQLLYLA